MADLNKHEQFTFTLDGEALKEHSISAKMLAQSLLGFDLIARNVAESLYNKSSYIDIKVKALREGSFNIDLILEYSKNIKTITDAIVSCGAVIFGIIKLGKFLKGRCIKEQSEDKDNHNIVKVTNYYGEVLQFSKSTVKIFNKNNTKIQLDRITRTLDESGVDIIKISSGNEEESITKDERTYFKREDGSVITDEENTLVLEVINASLNGDPRGWRFYDGDHEFSAIIEDEAFLRRVVEEKIAFKNGTQIEATVRFVQKRGSRITNERTILEVHQILHNIEE